MKVISQYVRVKICCVRSVEEANLAIRYGASALGLLLSTPYNLGGVSESRLLEITSLVPTAVESFLLTEQRDVSSIVEMQRHFRVKAIQICTRLESSHDYGLLRRSLPGIDLLQVIYVTGENAIEDAVWLTPYVDGILLDSPKELGGASVPHDWSISKKICELVTVPVFLAGGLNPGNVAEAIREVRPFAVDVCQGVRNEGKLDELKLAQFFYQIRSEATQDYSRHARRGRS